MDVAAATTRNKERDRCLCDGIVHLGRYAGESNSCAGSFSWNVMPSGPLPVAHVPLAPPGSQYAWWSFGNGICLKWMVSGSCRRRRGVGWSGKDSQSLLRERFLVVPHGFWRWL